MLILTVVIVVLCTILGAGYGYLLERSKFPAWMEVFYPLLTTAAVILGGIFLPWSDIINVVVGTGTAVFGACITVMYLKHSAEAQTSS